MRRLARTALEALLRTTGILLYRTRLHHAVLWAARRRVRVLCYHASEEAEDDWIAGLGCNTPPSLLRSHLAFLRRHYAVVSLQQLESGALPDRAVMITFDDGYRSVYRVAFALLRAHGLAAVVYLVTDTVGNRAVVWVNELNWFLRRHGAIARQVATERLGLPAGASISSILDAARVRYDTTVVTSLLSELRSRTGTVAEALAAEANLYVTWDQVREMAEHGISFGNHTAAHPNMARLTESTQLEQMQLGRQALLSRGLSCTSLACPFGIATQATGRLATQLGHRSVMELGGGNQRLDLLHIGRLLPRATTDAALFAELEIVAPVFSLLRSLRSRTASLAGLRHESRAGY